MRPFGLQGSNDGATFGTALEISAHKLRVYPVHEFSNSVVTPTGRKYPKKFTYMVVELLPAREYFDPSDAEHGADAEDNWELLKEILMSPFIRIYNDDTACYPLWDGEDMFNSKTNTNLTILRNTEAILTDMDGFGDDAQMLRSYRIELITRDPVRAT